MIKEIRFRLPINITVLIGIILLVIGGSFSTIYERFTIGNFGLITLAFVGLVFMYIGMRYNGWPNHMFKRHGTST